MQILIKDITADHKLSPREGVNNDIVDDYRDCFDQLPPIVVFKITDREKYILADGWHRLAAAKQLGMEQIEAQVLFGTLDQAKEYALIANLKHGLPLTRKEKRHVIAEFLKLHSERSNNWIAEDLGASDTTIDKIRRELIERSQIKNVNTLLGKDGKEYPYVIEQPKKETESGNNDESAEPEEETLPPPPVPMLGPFQLNAVHHMDCIEALTQLPESSIDLVFADPPYNLGKDYGASSNDRLPADKYFKWCVQWFMGAYRVLRPGGAFYVMHYPEVAATWKQQLDGFFAFQRWITWVYPSNVGHSKNNWTRAHRAILYYTKGDAAFFDGEADPQPYKNPDDRRVKHSGKRGVTPYDWWKYNLVKNNSSDKVEWPNQLPVELAYRIVVSSCPVGGVVCDPFMGGGTTAAAAIEAGRDWIGFDIEEEACWITQGRVDGEQNRAT